MLLFHHALKANDTYTIVAPLHHTYFPLINGIYPTYLSPLIFNFTSTSFKFILVVLVTKIIFLAIFISKISPTYFLMMVNSRQIEVTKGVSLDLILLILL